MTELIRRFRGFGIAAVVLALSASAVFASSAGLSFRLTSDHQTASETSETADASETSEPTETPDATDQAQANTDTNGAQPSDNHGALVSTAAQMTTPDGFANHGAFVSCIAHMKDASPTFDLTTVTPETCGLTPTAAPTQTSDTQTKADAGKAKGAAGRANGAAHRAAAQANH